MKKLIAIASMLCLCLFATAQTDTVRMKKGTVYTYDQGDAITVIGKCPAAVINYVHDTVKIKLTKSDSLAIQALKICPAIPAPAKQRTVIRETEIYDGIKRTVKYDYDDGTTSTL